MSPVRLYPNLKRLKDRHGRLRIYLRVPGGKLVPLPTDEGSPAFREAYEAAVAGCPSSPELASPCIAPRSIAALVVAYQQSPEWAALASSTKQSTRLILKRLVLEHGDRPVASMRPEHVRALIRQRSSTPAAANRLRKVLRRLMWLAIELSWRQDNPTRDTRPLGYEKREIATWSEDDITRFCDRWPLGTREHLALALLLFTGQRQSDVVRMGTQHLRDGGIEVQQKKTGTRLWVPVHPDLATAIAAHPSGSDVFLVTAAGKPFTVAGIGNWLRDARAAAGMSPEMSPHGLRKAAARRLSEAGCSALEIQSITGHRSLRELEVYVREVNQRRLAGQAMSRLLRSKISNLTEQ